MNTAYRLVLSLILSVILVGLSNNYDIINYISINLNNLYYLYDKYIYNILFNIFKDWGVEFEVDNASIESTTQPVIETKLNNSVNGFFKDIKNYTIITTLIWILFIKKIPNLVKNSEKLNSDIIEKIGVLELKKIDIAENILVKYTLALENLRKNMESKLITIKKKIELSKEIIENNKNEIIFEVNNTVEALKTLKEGLKNNIDFIYKTHTQNIKQEHMIDIISSSIDFLKQVITEFIEEGSLLLGLSKMLLLINNELLSLNKMLGSSNHILENIFEPTKNLLKLELVAVEENSKLIPRIEIIEASQLKIKE